MAATYMLRKHQATMESAAKPEAIAEREINREASRLAKIDREKRFPRLTEKNFEQAANYQNSRREFWARQLIAHT